jgi:hypothetical protein
MKRTNIAIAAAVLVLAAAIAARAADKKPFSHKFHISDAGADCAACHDAKAGRPELTTKGCADCHDKGTPAWSIPARHRESAIKFPHRRHADAKGLACKTCHDDVASDAVRDGSAFLPYAKCVSCHAEKKVAISDSACAKCHGADAEKTPPPGHKEAWPARHGKEASWVEKGEHGKDCSLCHGDSSCRACHMLSTPKDHTGLWRVRTHGSAASFDRDRCKTCHETGTCVRCHATSKPANHAGAWNSLHGLTAGAKDNESCRACHQKGWCKQCHRKK